MAKRKPPPPPADEPEPEGERPSDRPGRAGGPPPEDDLPDDLSESRALVFMSDSDVRRLDSDEELPPAPEDLGESRTVPPPRDLSESQALILMSESDVLKFDSSDELPEAPPPKRAEDVSDLTESSALVIMSASDVRRYELDDEIPLDASSEGAPAPPPPPEKGKRAGPPAKPPGKPPGKPPTAPRRAAAPPPEPEPERSRGPIALYGLLLLAVAGVSAGTVHVVEGKWRAAEIEASREEERRALARDREGEAERRAALEAEVAAKDRELDRLRRQVEDARREVADRLAAAEAEGRRRAREELLDEAKRAQEALQEGVRKELEAAVLAAEQRAKEAAARERLDLERRVRETVERYEALLVEAENRRKAEQELTRREARAEILRREGLLREKLEEERLAFQREKEQAIAEETRKLEERLRAEFAADRGGFIRGPEGVGLDEGEGIDLEREVSEHLAGTLGGSVEYRLKAHLEGSDQPDAGRHRNEGIAKLRYEASFAEDQVTVKVVPRLRYDDDKLTHGVQEELDDEAVRRPVFTLEEAWVGVRMGLIDAALGKQIFAFGTADLVNPTDVMNPVDFTDLLDSEKIGVFALDVSVYPTDDLRLRAIFLPTFTPSRLPIEGERFSLFPPEGIIVITPQGPLGPIDVTRREEPEDEKAMGGAFRASATVGSVDFSLTYLTAPNDLPQLEARLLPGPPFLELAPVYDRIHMFGADFATTLDLPALGEVELHGEAAQFFTEGPRDDDYLLYVFGASYTFADPILEAETTLVLEYAGEWKNKDLEAEDVIPASAFGRAFKSAVLGRLGWKPLDRLELLTTAVALLHGPNSYYVRPEVRYEIGAHTKVNLGFEVLEGPGDSFFGQFTENDRFFLSLKLTF